MLIIEVNQKVAYDHTPLSQNENNHILVSTARGNNAIDLVLLLEQTGFRVTRHCFEEEAVLDLKDFHLITIDGDSAHTSALSFCRRLRSRLVDTLLPILFVTDEVTPSARLAGLESGADNYLLRPFHPGELLAHIRALLRLKSVHDRLSEKTIEVTRMNKRLQQAHQQMDQELQWAQRLQLSFLPHSLPKAPRLSFGIHFRQCGRVGGDFYDVFRLDEHHVGFYVADAMGHGIPASLLTIFIKMGVRGKEIYDKHYRLIPPDEVLKRLNHALLEQALADHPFITMVYALLNHHDGTLTFARAGHPYPLHLPKDGQPQFLQIPGSLLGVFDTTFTLRTDRLQPGDKLLFYTDGVENVSFQGLPTGADSLLACAHIHRQQPVQPWVDAIALDLWGGQTNRPDDVTLFGVEIGSEENGK